MDYQFDATAEGRKHKFLNVNNEYSRLCLAIRVGGRCKVTDVLPVLEDLTSLFKARCTSDQTTGRSSLLGL